MSYTREDIVRVARSYLGTRFKIRGRTRHGGIDCVGLLWLIAQEIGDNAPDDLGYTEFPDSDQFKAHLRACTAPGSLQNLRNGSIGVFRQAALPMHCGLITIDRGVAQVVNANLRRRMVVEQPWAAWASLLVEVREFRGVSQS